MAGSPCGALPSTNSILVERQRRVHLPGGGPPSREQAEVRADHRTGRGQSEADQQTGYERSLARGHRQPAVARGWAAEGHSADWAGTARAVGQRPGIAKQRVQPSAERGRR